MREGMERGGINVKKYEAFWEIPCRSICRRRIVPLPLYGEEYISTGRVIKVMRRGQFFPYPRTSERIQDTMRRGNTFFFSIFIIPFFHKALSILKMLS
jgi:hypothetical protein